VCRLTKRQQPEKRAGFSTFLACYRFLRGECEKRDILGHHNENLMLQEQVLGERQKRKDEGMF
jgi:hypothetical protein